MAISLKELAPFRLSKEKRPKPPVRVTEEQAARLLRKKINDVMRRTAYRERTGIFSGFKIQLPPSEILFAISSEQDGRIPHLHGKVKTSVLERGALQKVGLEVMKDYGFDPEKDFRKIPTIAGDERMYKTGIEGLEFHRVVVYAPRAKRPSSVHWAAVKTLTLYVR